MRLTFQPQHLIDHSRNFLSEIPIGAFLVHRAAVWTLLKIIIEYGATVFASYLFHILFYDSTKSSVFLIRNDGHHHLIIQDARMLTLIVAVVSFAIDQYHIRFGDADIIAYKLFKTRMRRMISEEL